MEVPKLLTAGGIAAAVDAPLHRVLHVLRTRRHIEPAARAGTLRLFRLEVIDLVRVELQQIERRRARTTRLRIIEGRRP